MVFKNCKKSCYPGVKIKHHLGGLIRRQDGEKKMRKRGKSLKNPDGLQENQPIQ